MKFSAKVLQQVDTEPGCVRGARMGVFDEDDKQVGEYLRNYASFGPSTFFPFELGGKWYALYSREYMYTRVMSLPDCRDLGGEDKTTVEYKNHFCPMMFFVPELTLQTGSRKDDPEPSVPNHQPDVWATKVTVDKEDVRYTHYFWPDDKKGPEYSPEREAEYKAAYVRQHALLKEWGQRHEFETRFAPFGFVGGCMWGDDSGGLKVQMIDLRQADKGIIRRLWQDVYVQLAPGVDLEQGVVVYDKETCWDDLDIDDPKTLIIEVAVPKCLRLDGRPLVTE